MKMSQKIRGREEKCIHYEKLVERNDQINKLKSQGMIVLPKKNFEVAGWISVFIAIVTIPIPLTTPIFLMIGLTLIVISKQQLIDKIKHKCFMIKYRLRR